MDSATLTIFVTLVIGFTGLAIGIFAGLATLWTGVRNAIAGLRAELREMSVRVSETELEQARQEGANRVLERLAHREDWPAIRARLRLAARTPSP